MTDTYAKFINAAFIQKAPQTKGNVSNYHLLPDLLVADGFQKLRSTPQKPNDGKMYILTYRQIDEEIEPFWFEVIQPQPTYYEQRAQAYPEAAEYLDAQVKINSGDSELTLTGQAQLAKYFQQCLAVKEQFPKPQTEENNHVNNTGTI